MKPYKRIFTIVIDSLGVGAMPNAAEYDDEGCDTLGHIDASMPKFHIPNLAKLGLANLHPLKHVAPYHGPVKAWGPGSRAPGLLYEAAGSQCRQGYDDRTLGNDGTAYHDTV